MWRTFPPDIFAVDIDPQGLGLSSTFDSFPATAKQRTPRAAAGPLDLRARLRLGRGTRRGQLYLSYGALAAGVDLRDGQRDLRLIRPLAWFESGSALTDQPSGGPRPR